MTLDIIPDNKRHGCKGCKHLDVNNNPEIGYDVCCGEYCDYSFIPIPEEAKQ